MRLFVGLGNPGAKYAHNRHNIGFMAVGEIARRHGFAPWRRRFQGETAEGTLDQERVILLRPLTFMNESGRAVQEAAGFFKLAAGEITVFRPYEHSESFRVLPLMAAEGECLGMVAIQEGPEARVRVSEQALTEIRQALVQSLVDADAPM